jgi:hypothetical protein
MGMADLVIHGSNARMCFIKRERDS